MPYDSLSDFLSERQDENDLVRIAAQVDPDLELAEITSRAATTVDGGPVLLFENVLGSEFPLVTNLLGSHARICRPSRTSGWHVKVRSTLLKTSRRFIPAARALPSRRFRTCLDLGRRSRRLTCSSVGLP